MLCGHLLLFITYCKHHDYSQRSDVLSHQITPAKTKKFPCSLFCLPCRVFRSAQPKSPCAFGTTKSNRHPPHLHNAFAAQLPFQGIKKMPFLFHPVRMNAEPGKLLYPVRHQEKLPYPMRRQEKLLKSEIKNKAYGYVITCRAIFQGDYKKFIYIFSSYNILPVALYNHLYYNNIELCLFFFTLFSGT